MTNMATPIRSALPGLRVLAGLVSLIAAQPALAASRCPGNPDTVGISRTIVVDPREHPRIGAMQYAETLPLQDHEIVLTFDDGPLPKYSNQILGILAANCLKATFFVVGQMARTYPDGVRKLRDAGHTIGTHTQNHPLTMNRMLIERARREIDDGIAATTAALGGEAPAPFFRIPGLLRAHDVEEYAASQGLQVWSADFPADDWKHIPASKVYDLAMSRIEAKGKGVLLLHDIQPRTVAALPHILRDLIAKGYRFVHVVPATPDLPKTPTDPQQWRAHPAIVATRWPAVPAFAFARSELLPIPAMPNAGLSDGALMLLPEPFERVKRLALSAPLPIDLPWSEQSSSATFASAAPDAGLPIPAAGVFSVPERTAKSIVASLPMHSKGRRSLSYSALPEHALLEAGAAKRAISHGVPVTGAGLHH